MTSCSVGSTPQPLLIDAYKGHTRGGLSTCPVSNPPTCVAILPISQHALQGANKILPRTLAREVLPLSVIYRAAVSDFHSVVAPINGVLSRGRHSTRETEDGD